MCWRMVGTSGEGLLFFWDLVPILAFWVAEPITRGPALREEVVEMDIPPRLRDCGQLWAGGPQGPM